MIDSIEALTRLFAETPLASRPVAEVAVPDSPLRAFAVKIESMELVRAWGTARRLLDASGRWPLAVSVPASAASWQESVADADLFNRFFYQEAEDTADISPRGVLAAAARVDVPAFLARLEEEQLLNRPFGEAEIESALEETRQRCGNAPAAAAVGCILQGLAATAAPHALERFLLEWEQTHCAEAPPEDTCYQDWLTGEGYPSALLFLPSPHPWDALAYIHYFGSSPLGSEYYVALGRSWQQRFGAELVAHYGTMLQVVAPRRPTTMNAALELAREHDLAALDTLSRTGVSLRAHARFLLGHDRWFLHQRP